MECSLACRSPSSGAEMLAGDSQLVVGEELEAADLARVDDVAEVEGEFEVGRFLGEPRRTELEHGRTWVHYLSRNRPHRHTRGEVEQGFDGHDEFVRADDAVVQSGRRTMIRDPQV